MRSNESNLQKEYGTSEKMTQPPTTTATPGATTYTTIPISAGDVVSRSLQNLSNAISRRRPWPELISSGSFSRPDSFPTALTRFKANFAYFLINYYIITAACAAVSLIGSPISLIGLALIFSLWLLLYFFREDPLVLMGYHVGDRLVFVGLVLVTVLGVWASRCFGSLVLGVLLGLLICGVHAVLRNSDGLVHDQEEGLIASGSAGSGYGTISDGSCSFTNKLLD